MPTKARFNEPKESAATSAISSSERCAIAVRVLLIYGIIFLISGLWAAARQSQENIVGSVQSQLFEERVWSQPEAVSVNYPVKVSSSNWRFDYAPIETLLAGFPKNAQSELMLSPSIVRMMDQLLSYLPNPLAEKDLARIEYLTTASFPGEQGRQMAELIKGFVILNRAETKGSGTLNNEVSNDEQTADLATQLFEEKVEFRERVLGIDITRTLFEEQHRIKRYLLARRSIRESSTLGAQQKAQSLYRLKQEFEAQQRARRDYP